MNYNPYASPTATPAAQPYYGGGGNGGGQGPVPVGVVLRQSWELFKANAGVAVGAFFLVGFVLSIPAFGPMIGVLWYYFGDFFNAVMSGAHGGRPPALVLPPDFYAMQPLLTVWAVTVQQIFVPGMARMNIAIARNESPGMGVIFSAFGRVPAAIGWALLAALPQLLAQAFVALVALSGASHAAVQAVANLVSLAALPILLLNALGLIYTQQFIADRNLGPIAAAKAAWTAASRYRGETFMLLIALLGFNILGVCACYVGLFVTLPWSMVAISYAYNQLPKDEAPAY